MATGQSLIQNEIKKALSMPLDNISKPVYDGVWCNYILHTNRSGTFVSIDIDPDFQQKHIRNIGLIVKPGDKVVPFTGANNSLGTLFLQFESRMSLDSALSNMSKFITINIR
jgi:hypothetical protein